MFTVFNRMAGPLVERTRRFCREDAGQVAIIFGLTAAAAAFSMGAAIDYTRAVGARSKLQASVDAALLAATKAPAAQRVSAATTILQAHLAGSGISATWRVSPSLNADGSITGVAAGSISTTALGIARITELPVAASATAKIVQKTVQSPASMTFTLTGASGWYWKEVDLYTHLPGATSDMLLASYIYQPTNLNNSGTGTVTAQFSSGVGSGMLAGPVDTPVSLGSGYDKAYLVMTVYSDGCAPGYGPKYPNFGSNSSYWNPFVCLPVGSTWTSTSTNRYGQTVTTTNTVTKTTSPVQYSTDDAATAHNLFVNDVALPNNVKPNFFSLFNCGQTTTHDWEDTPWGNPLPGTWSQQDIHFTIASTCAANTNIAGAGPVLAQ
jgi:hypothetical protein